MDTISHALWGKGLFGYRRYGYLALLFGALPDLLSFGIYFLFNILTNPLSMEFGKPSLSSLPTWLFYLYDFSHSIIIAFIFIIIVYKINKKICFTMLAWPLHIIIDFFTHSIKYFPTPIFWPVSEYRYDGVPWSNPWIWFGNIFCIVIIFIYRKKYS